MEEIIQSHYQLNLTYPILFCLAGIALGSVVLMVISVVTKKKLHWTIIVATGFVVSPLGYRFGYGIGELKAEEKKARALEFWQASQREDAYIQEGYPYTVMAPVEFGNKVIERPVASLSTCEFKELMRVSETYIME